MAGTITAISIQKRNKERVNVYIDGEFALAVTVFAAAALRKGQYLSEADIERLKEGDVRDKAYERAIRFLGYRPRSQAEVKRYLTEKGYVADVVEDTIGRLIDQQYLDDEAFARYWLENREKFRPRGGRALRYELRQKGIADQVIDGLLGDLDEEALAWAAVQKKMYTWRGLSEDELKKKLVGFLARRGFNYEIANTVFQRARTRLELSDASGDSMPDHW